MFLGVLILDNQKSWVDVGIMRRSDNSEVILISIFELPNYIWFIVNKKELLDLIRKKRFEISIKQKNIIGRW